jgi:hypothetical protein
MKKLILLVVTVVLFLSLIGILCSIADCRIIGGTPDGSDFLDGRIYLGGEPPYPYIPTQTPKRPTFPIFPMAPID